MPTRNRRQFVAQSIFYFLRQDYPIRELIVVDDGEDAVRDLIPDDDRIRYLRLDRPLTIGAKRNLAARVSTGALIAHWDDDDWMAPDRLTRQVAALHAADARVCGASSLLWYRPTAAAAWRVQIADVSGAPVACGSLLYERSVWEAHPFQERDSGEEVPFLAHLDSRALHIMADSSFYVGILHDSNAHVHDLSGAGCEPRSVSEAVRILADDAAFYLGLRRAGGRLARRPGSVGDASSQVATNGLGLRLVATFDVCSGYGSMAELLALGLDREGVHLQPVPIGLNRAGLTAELTALLDRAPDPRAPVLYFSPVESNAQRFRSADHFFVNTMWESSQLPASWVAVLNDARVVIVPTTFVAESCRASGVTVPIEVVPEGIDPATYHWLNRPERPGLTTMMVGPVDHRKHVLVGIAAWRAAFAEDREARLIIKTSYGYHNYTSDDPRITYVDAREDTRGIAHWYQQADVLLALGNEGFGLPLVEGMATGLPVIALSSEGQGDVCREARACLLPVEPERRQPYPWNGATCGVQGVPGWQDVAARLRWVAEHRDEARAMGQAASAWATENRSIWTKAPAVVDILERYSASARPIRRRDTFWVPSWETPCGIAEYTARLAESLPAVRVDADVADLGGVRMLHVQHAFPLFDDTRLTRHVQRAHQARVPVVVTEHIVVDRTHAWERDADALVALTEAGAQRLRRTWPDKRVVHIPCGCPPWISPRVRARRRASTQVIGAFGFLDRHKGLWHLLDVLRSLPNTELLLFSYARDAETAEAWKAASAGLPVRWIDDYLPLDEIAQRLAAEADVLSFWYDDVPFDSASSAAHVGLATGSPVLTSPTRWFRDLRDVTYQPESLVEGVERLLEDTALRASLTEAAREYCHQHAWSRIADRHRALWTELRCA